MTFENSWDPAKTQENVGPDLDPNCLTFWWYPQGGVGGNSIPRLGPFFGGFKSWISIFFGVFRKMNIFWGRTILWIFFEVITKLDWFWRSFLCILGYFLKVNVQNGDFFRVAKISNIYWGIPEIPDILFGETVDAGFEPTYEINKTTPPPPGSTPGRKC